MIEGRVGERRASAVGKLLARPVGQCGLFIVEEDAAVFDRRAAVRATFRRDEEVRVRCNGDVSPPDIP